MPSITTWSRIEPQTSAADGEGLGAGFAARVHDPLWLLARQWQVGEFQGEDCGTPILARWRGRVSPMRRFVAGPVPVNTQVDGPRFDAASVPLETLVERQVVAEDGLRRAVEDGLHFLRLLGQQRLFNDPSAAFASTYAVPEVTEEQRASLDPETLGYAELVAGRALDARRLRGALGDPATPRLDPALGIDTGDRAEVVEAYRAWVAWSDTLFSEPGAGAPQDGQTWQPDRLEHVFSLSTRLGDDIFGERTLTAQQYADGTLDWYSFDVNAEISLGSGQDEPGEVLTRTVVPAPVTFHGMPARRFWELEDARIDLGALRPGATDLAQLLMVETLTGFGNDWFVLPIELPVGSLVESRSLVVTDTFGVRSLLRPTGDSALANRRGFSMFSHTLPFGPGTEVAVPNLLFLAPTVTPIDGPVLEEVMLVRDELANLGWAVERRLESPLEVGLETATDTPDLASEPAAPRDVPVYRLATPLPAHWVPLIPVRVTDDSAEVRLAPGAVLDLSGVPRVVSPQARLLDPGPGRLLIREEEVPREGVVVRRTYQAARWYDGRLFVWSGNRTSIGRGEASSGLAFDDLVG
ncbi:MAG TPA: hypothetical protein VER39_00295 [Nocardioidaceae bacterium]|nr:hypothetical protein [Nocardioidaceae bacterium]